MMKKCLFIQHVTINQAHLLHVLIKNRYGGLVKPYFVAVTAMPADIEYDGYIEKVTDWLAERLTIYAEGAISALNVTLTTPQIAQLHTEFRTQP